MRIAVIARSAIQPLRPNAVHLMCDYSLHAIASRPAKAGDKLVLTSFWGTATRGFAAEADRNVAVCLMPGTELGFAQEVRYDRHCFWSTKTGFSVARFRKVEKSGSEPHQDALEFPDGRIVLVTKLVPGQRAHVLQLPPQEKAEPQLDANTSKKLAPEALL